VTPGHPVIVEGCDYEDDCIANYDPNGTWTITWAPDH
jgi:hypothetical protein